MEGLNSAWEHHVCLLMRGKGLLRATQEGRYSRLWSEARKRSQMHFHARSRYKFYEMCCLKKLHHSKKKEKEKIPLLHFEMHHTVCMKPMTIIGHFWMQGGENHQKARVNIRQQMRCWQTKIHLQIQQLGQNLCYVFLKMRYNWTKLLRMSSRTIKMYDILPIYSKYEQCV